MSDNIKIRLGPTSRPWDPAPGTQLCEVFDRYDIPLMGHIKQDNVDYLFWCVTGAVEPASIWAYTWVSEQELAELYATNAHDFDRVFAKLTVGKPTDLVFYSDEGGIQAATQVDDPASFESLLESARAAFRELTSQVAVAAGYQVVTARQ